MKSRHHDCGSCKFFQKWKNDKLKDARTKTDHGRGCREYKRVKFHRPMESLV